MSTTQKLNAEKIKEDFPLLDKDQDGKKLVFLDSAASSQKPVQVIEAVSNFYKSDYANVHRGVYRVAERATNAYEQARRTIANFVGAQDPNEIVFTKNATESINLVASSWGRTNLNKGDVVVLSTLEHHANIVPWQMLASEKSIEIKWIPVDGEGRLELDDIENLLSGAKLVAVSAMSNVTGAVSDLESIIAAAKNSGCATLIDACQSVPHMPVDVNTLGCDFMVFSGHKMLGPSGIGVLWGKKQLLEEMPPYLGGGGMILDVSTSGFVSAELPAKFEAGTPPIAQAVGLAAAADYLTSLGMDKVWDHEAELTLFALEQLEELGNEVKILGPKEGSNRGAVLSLEVKNVHAHDVSQVLDQHAVCVRPGHHCAKPLMRQFGVAATARASFYVYNTKDDVNSLTNALKASIDFFK